MDESIKRAEAGPFVPALYLRPHSTSIASIAASRFFTQINQFRLLSYFCVSVPYTIGCTWILCCNSLFRLTTVIIGCIKRHCRVTCNLSVMHHNAHRLLLVSACLISVVLYSQAEF